MIAGNGRTPGPGQVPWPGHPGSALGAVRQLTHPERRVLTFKPCSARRRARHVAPHPRSLREADGHNKVLSLTAGGSDRRPGLALATPLSRAGQRLERKVSAEPEITAPRAAGRNDHSAHRNALRPPMLDGGTAEGRQDRRGRPVLRQRPLPDPDPTALPPIAP